jgi:hypothetical protein
VLRLKNPCTLVVIDADERVVAQHRFANDRSGYRSMKAFARAHRYRVWAVEGARGVGAGLAHRLVAEDELALDVPVALGRQTEPSLANWHYRSVDWPSQMRV